MTPEQNKKLNELADFLEGQVTKLRDLIGVCDCKCPIIDGGKEGCKCKTCDKPLTK